MGVEFNGGDDLPTHRPSTPGPHCMYVCVCVLLCDEWRQPASTSLHRKHILHIPSKGLRHDSPGENVQNSRRTSGVCDVLDRCTADDDGRRGVTG